MLLQNGRGKRQRELVSVRSTCVSSWVAGVRKRCREGGVGAMQVSSEAAGDPGQRCALEDQGRLLRKDGWTGSETADELIPYDEN